MNFDTGSTGFMLVATSLVMLMTPGLAFFYGGLVSRKGVPTIMMQSFVSLGWTTVLWYICGYSLCFSTSELIPGVIGGFDMAFLSGLTLATPFGDGQIPLFLFIGYQMMFAVITPALITGASTNRVRFPAYMIFLTLWLFFVYFPLVHMVWGGGILAQWGVLDFAGGIVTPASAAMIGIAAGLVCYAAVALKNKLKWDDALDVWGVHGVGGTVGIVMLGLFASKAANPAGANGLFVGEGGAAFLMREVASVVGVSIYAFLFTYVMLILINKVTSVRVSDAEQEAGLDASLHGETAYLEM